MEVLPLMMLVSFFLVSLSILFMIFSVKQKDHEHADRISLAPLRDDDGHVPAGSRDASEE